MTAGLPERRDLSIGHRKIVDYLLNLDHPEGGSKARFFLSFGFAVDQPADLALALLDHASPSNFAHTKASPYGTKLVYEGALRTPSGRSPNVRSIWMRDDRGLASLVTVTPC